MKGLLSPDRSKMVLAVFLTIFAPLPMYAIVMMGIAPPALILIFAVVYSSAANLLLAMIAFLLFLAHTFLAYWIACILARVVRLITRHDHVRWLPLAILLLLLVVVSFFPVYRVADVGGGRQVFNIIDLFLRWPASISSAGH